MYWEHVDNRPPQKILQSFAQESCASSSHKRKVPKHFRDDEQEDADVTQAGCKRGGFRGGAGAWLKQECIQDRWRDALWPPGLVCFSIMCCHTCILKADCTSVYWGWVGALWTRLASQSVCLFYLSTLGIFYKTTLDIKYRKGLWKVYGK